MSSRTIESSVAKAGWSQAREVLGRGGEQLALHVRGPATSGRSVLDHVRDLQAAADASGAALVVNDRVDVALVHPVWGVQLGERSLPVAEARTLLGSGVWLGASVHSVGRARDAEGSGADYLVVGTIYATSTHPGRAGAGPEFVRELAAESSLRLLAIGGVTPERVGAVCQAGAHGAAVLSGVWEASDPAAAVGTYLGALARAGDALE